MTRLATGIMAGVLLLPVAATAADLPSRVAPPVVVPPAAFTWTGFYIGANAGYGFGGRDTDGPSNLVVPAGIVGAFPVVPAAGGPFLAGNGGQHDGFVGGGQLGYNYQFGTGSGLVIGIEADFQYSGLHAGHQDGGLAGGLGSAVPSQIAFVGPANNGFGIAPIGTGLATAPGNVAFFNGGRRGPGDFLGTIRSRVGYAFDRLLVYATGGFAYSNSREAGVNGGFVNGRAIPASFYTGTAAQAAGAAVGPSFNVNRASLAGYTVGGGIEYALPSGSFLDPFKLGAVTLKVEGLFVDLGRTGLTGTQIIGVSNTGAPISATYSSQRNNDFGLVRVGLNYKFGAPAAPVVARY